MKRRIALDFDGCIVHSYDSSLLTDKSHDVIQLLYLAGWEIDIVTARRDIDVGFIWRMVPIDIGTIITCGTTDAKIEYLNAHSEDYLVIIDDTFEVISNVNIPFKIHFKADSISEWNRVELLLLKNKLMSPGPVNFNTEVYGIDFHHRSDTFRNLFRQCQQKVVTNHFNDSWEVFFTQGSGTSALQIAVHGFATGKRVLIHVNGTFGDRLHEMVSRVADFVHVVDNINDITVDLLNKYEFDVFFGVVFETSKSIYNDYSYVTNLTQEFGVLNIVDMVSALGYYQIPENVDIVCSSASKILRALPSLGIVAYKASCLDRMVNESKSFYFDFGRYVTSAKQGETPHTSLIPQLMSYFQTEPETPANIKVNCTELDFENTLIMADNERVAPVLTLKFKSGNSKDSFLRYCQLFNYNLYYNENYMTDYIQIGMFNGPAEMYQFLNQIIQASK